jgi:hypothetical protein
MQSSIFVLKEQPKALWAYLGLSLLIVVSGLAGIGNASFDFDFWADGLWIALVLAVMAGVTTARYLLCAVSSLAFLRLALTASQRYGVGEVFICAALVGQIALLCSPSFRERDVR